MHTGLHYSVYLFIAKTQATLRNQSRTAKFIRTQVRLNHKGKLKTAVHNTQHGNILMRRPRKRERKKLVYKYFKVPGKKSN